MKLPLYSKTDEARLVTEDSGPESDRTIGYRSPWRRDYARLIHSPAFRRLQGKTQLFPSPESDFFRNRLTHSIEVAQIAKTIATKANQSKAIAGHLLDLDLIEFAGLAHDLGHPPFGHNGEHALNECMYGRGGFEGNAQTLRLLAVMEKKKLADGAAKPFGTDGVDQRKGLNLTYRSLAAILKYDEPILSKKKQSLDKGYYTSERDLVKAIKKHVAPKHQAQEFKTIECQIMDIADDIAYSTYDLEDSFKAGFLTPLQMLAYMANRTFRVRLVEDVQDAIRKALRTPRFWITEEEIYRELEKMFAPILSGRSARRTRASSPVMNPAVAVAVASNGVAENGYMRTQFTAGLVHAYVEGVRFTPNTACPALSKAYLPEPVLKKVEILKRFTFLATIMSPRLQIANFRGREIVSNIFETLSSKGGHLLLPSDVQELYEGHERKTRPRVICDFIAGMTDRYAVEFYQRIKSADGLTIFKPH